MEFESRAKYKGVKVHLDEVECQAFLDWRKNWKKTGNQDNDFLLDQISLISKAIKDLLKTNPDVLKDRTPEQITEALNKDKAKIEKQLAAGKKWKEVE